MMISPRSVILPLCAIESGTLRMVRTFCVMSSPTVPSPRVLASDEAPALVDDLDARAVELRLDAEARRLAVGEPIDDAAMKLGQLLGRIRVVEREHPRAVLDLDHPGARLAPDPLGRRVGRSKLRVRVFERLELAQQAVELRVRRDRVVEDVVAVVVRVDLAHESGVTLRGSHGAPRSTMPGDGRGLVRAPDRPLRRGLQPVQRLGELHHRSRPAPHLPVCGAPVGRGPPDPRGARPVDPDGDHPDSIVVVDGGRLYERSAALLCIARHMRGAWPLLAALVVIPRPLRDALYRWLAARRYRWFGRSDTCRVPTPELRARFLE